eukprot:7525401-Karenia_brevis.AAC.1
MDDIQKDFLSELYMAPAAAGASNKPASSVSNMPDEPSGAGDDEEPTEAMDMQTRETVDQMKAFAWQAQTLGFQMESIIDEKAQAKGLPSGQDPKLYKIAAIFEAG